MQKCVYLLALQLAVLFAPPNAAADNLIHVAIFQADVTPPLGSPLDYGWVAPAKKIDDRLTARGIVLMGEGRPIVLCAVDWVGIRNEAYDAWREALAAAVGTTADRVSVNTLHQHDTPGVDYTADELLRQYGAKDVMHDVAATRAALTRTARAAKNALKSARPITHVGIGKARVHRVASSRRVLGPDGKVKYVRYSSTRDEAIRAAPEGTIDPYVRLLTLWDGDTPLVAMSYYATHPQSYYGRGGVSADFVGMARSFREQELPGIAHIHFNGAGGNVTAGKYNDGSEENRPVLARRLADGMKAAWEQTNKKTVTTADLDWQTTDVQLPIKQSMSVDSYIDTLRDPQAKRLKHFGAALKLAWMQRVKSKRPIAVSCLRLGPARVLHLPGELFVEYQLAAQKMRPNRFVCLAAYGDSGPGYIGTNISYSQGGYETGEWSFTAPAVEDVLLDAMSKLLNKAEQ